MQCQLWVLLCCEEKHCRVMLHHPSHQIWGPSFNILLSVTTLGHCSSSTCSNWRMLSSQYFSHAIQLINLELIWSHDFHYPSNLQAGSSHTAFYLEQCLSGWLVSLYPPEPKPELRVACPVLWWLWPPFPLFLTTPLSWDLCSYTLLKRRSCVRHCSNISITRAVFVLPVFGKGFFINMAQASNGVQFKLLPFFIRWKNTH